MQSTGAVPREIVYSDTAVTLAPWNVAEEIREQFRKTKAALRAQQSGSLCLAVCSHDTGEGVSWFASKLACAFAEEPWASVLLLDARRGGRSSQLANFEIGAREGKEVAREGPVVFVQRPSGSPQLSVVSIECSLAHAAAAIDGALHGALGRLRTLAPVVIVDCDPMTCSAQLLHLADAVDGVLFVVEAERERREVIARSLEAVRRARMSVLGVVLTKQKRYIPGALYNLL